MASSSTVASAAAGTTVDLSDVGDPTISTLWKRIYSHLNSKQVGQGMAVCRPFAELLPPLVTHIELSVDWPNKKAAQQALQRVAATFTQLEKLEISAEEPHGQPKLDFEGLSFPCLTSLTLRCQPLQAVHFTTANTPKLQLLDLECCNEVGSFQLKLPELQQLLMQHCEVQDETEFGSSLSACPKLWQINCYKLWGLGGTLHELRLPECKEITLYRSDDLEGLKLWAPKLADLELRACYSLECVRLMEDPPGIPLTPIRVNLVNANIDPLSKQHLKQHPRVKARGGKLITKERDDPEGAWFNADTGEYGLDYDEDETDDDDDDDDGFGGGVGFGFMGGLAGMMDGGGGVDGGFVPMMHPLMQMMMGGAGNMVGLDGALHPAFAQMLMQEGLMEEGEEDPFGSGDGEDEDEDEDEDDSDGEDEEEKGDSEGESGMEADKADVGGAHHAADGEDGKGAAERKTEH